MSETVASNENQAPLDPALEALLRAVPMTRMTDYGLDLGTAQRVVAAARAGQVWADVCEEEAQRVLRTLPEAVGNGRIRLLRAAVAAYSVAQLSLSDDTSRKAELYDRLAETVDRVASEPGSGVRSIEIPYLGSKLAATLVSPARPDSAAPTGTVILFGGMNGWGVAYWGMADALVAHGLSVLLLELPGQGLTRIRHGLFGDDTLPRAVRAAVDWVVAQPSLGDRVGVCGNSFGGVVAALAASQDPRIAACVVNGAPATPELMPFRMVKSLMLPFFGTADEARVRSMLAGLDFAGEPRRVEGEVLVIHGGSDPLVSADAQRPFLEAARKGHWFERADGEHTLYNHPTERNAVMSGFFATRLAPSGLAVHQ